MPLRTALTRVSTAGWRRRWLLSVCHFAQRVSLVTTIKAARSPQTSPFGKSQTVKIDKSAPAAKMNSRAFAPFPTNRRGAGAGVSSKAGRGFARHLHTPERPVLYSVACKDYILRLSYGLIYCLFFVLTAGRWIDSIDVIDR